MTTTEQALAKIASTLEDISQSLAAVRRYCERRDYGSFLDAHGWERADKAYLLDHYGAEDAWENDLPSVDTFCRQPYIYAWAFQDYAGGFAYTRELIDDTAAAARNKARIILCRMAARAYARGQNPCGPFEEAKAVIKEYIHSQNERYTPILREEAKKKSATWERFCDEFGIYESPWEWEQDFTDVGL